MDLLILCPRSRVFVQVRTVKGGFEQMRYHVNQIGEKGSLNVSSFATKKEAETFKRYMERFFKGIRRANGYKHESALALCAFDSDSYRSGEDAIPSKIRLPRYIFTITKCDDPNCPACMEAGLIEVVA